MKTFYTKKTNATRAARSVLGASAKEGHDFVISGASGRFTWAKASKAKAKSSSTKRLQDQPQMKVLLAKCSRVGGATVAQLQEALGGVATHTVRGAISRLGDEGIEFHKPRDGRNVVYHVGK